MKNHRFLWLRNRTTNNRKCEKARNIKEKRTIEMFSTASRLPVALPSSASANQHFKLVQRCSKTPKNCGFSGFFYFTSSVAACLILAGFELFLPCFS